MQIVSSEEKTKRTITPPLPKHLQLEIDNLKRQSEIAQLPFYNNLLISIAGFVQKLNKKATPKVSVLKQTFLLYIFYNISKESMELKKSKFYSPNSDEQLACDSFQEIAKQPELITSILKTVQGWRPNDNLISAEESFETFREKMISCYVGKHKERELKAEEIFNQYKVPDTVPVDLVTQLPFMQKEEVEKIANDLLAKWEVDCTKAAKLNFIAVYNRDFFQKVSAKFCRLLEIMPSHMFDLKSNETSDEELLHAKKIFFENNLQSFFALFMNFLNDDFVVFCKNRKETLTFKLNEEYVKTSVDKIVPLEALQYILTQKAVGTWKKIRYEHVVGNFRSLTINDVDPLSRLSLLDNFFNNQSDQLNLLRFEQDEEFASVNDLKKNEYLQLLEDLYRNKIATKVSEELDRNLLTWENFQNFVQHQYLENLSNELIKEQENEKKSDLLKLDIIVLELFLSQSYEKFIESVKELEHEHDQISEELGQDFLNFQKSTSIATLIQQCLQQKLSVIDRNCKFANLEERVQQKWYQIMMQNNSLYASKHLESIENNSRKEAALQQTNLNKFKRSCSDWRSGLESLYEKMQSFDESFEKWQNAIVFVQKYLKQQQSETIIHQKREKHEKDKIDSAKTLISIFSGYKKRLELKKQHAQHLENRQLAEQAMHPENVTEQVVDRPVNRSERFTHNPYSLHNSYPIQDSINEDQQSNVSDQYFYWQDGNDQYSTDSSGNQYKWNDQGWTLLNSAPTLNQQGLNGPDWYEQACRQHPDLPDLMRRLGEANRLLEYRRYRMTE